MYIFNKSRQAFNAVNHELAIWKRHDSYRRFQKV